MTQRRISPWSIDAQHQIGAGGSDPSDTNSAAAAALLRGIVQASHRARDSKTATLKKETYVDTVFDMDAEAERALTDAKIAAAEARTDTKFAELIGRIDTQRAETRGEFLELRGEIRSLSASAASKGTVIGTGIVIFFSVLASLIGVLAYGSGAFYNGTVIRDMINHSSSQILPPK